MNNDTNFVIETDRLIKRFGRDRLAEAADKGSSISVDGSSGSATLKGLNDARIGLVESGSNWLIESGCEFDGAS